MKSKESSLVVLAAGMGSRYGGLKQMDGVGPCGEPLLAYSVYDAARAGFDKAVFVIREDFAEAFREKIAEPLSRHIPTECVYQRMEDIPLDIEVSAQRPKPWGTGHAVLAAESIAGTYSAVINADDFYGRAAYEEIMELFRAGSVTGNSAAMVGYELGNTLSRHGTVSRGLCRLEGSYLTGIDETVGLRAEGDHVISEDVPGSSFSLDQTVSMNFFGLHREHFRKLRAQFAQFLRDRGHDSSAEFYLPAALNQMIGEGEIRLVVRRSGEAWLGVTYAEDRAIVAEAIQKLVDAGVYPEKVM